jgi:hypothetical protein
MGLSRNLTFFTTGTRQSVKKLLIMSMYDVSYLFHYFASSGECSNHNYIYIG